MLLETNLPNLLHRGKVRDTYPVDEELLLIVATDRISAFDVVLPDAVSNKGRVLNRISAFWFEKTNHLIPNHFIGLADGPNVKDQYKGSSLMSAISPEIASQSMIVKKAERIDIECIVRGYITGSAWGDYRRSGTVSGKPMPEGLVEGDAFPTPIFTPTTKAEEGHDVNMSDQEVIDMVGVEMAQKLEKASKEVYAFAQEYAKSRRIILADTKMEFGTLNGELILIDVLLTPESSRFRDMDGYGPGKSQPNYDKQFVRDYLTEQGWNQEPPAPQLPEDVISKTTERYMEAYYRITGERL